MVRDYSMPKQEIIMTPSKQSLVKSLAKQGYTSNEIADYIGVSVTTIANTLKK